MVRTWLLVAGAVALAADVTVADGVTFEGPLGPPGPEPATVTEVAIDGLAPGEWRVVEVMLADGFRLRGTLTLLEGSTADVGSRTRARAPAEAQRLERQELRLRAVELVNDPDGPQAPDARLTFIFVGPDGGEALEWRAPALSRCAEVPWRVRWTVELLPPGHLGSIVCESELGKIDIHGVPGMLYMTVIADAYQPLDIHIGDRASIDGDREFAIGDRGRREQGMRARPAPPWPDLRALPGADGPTRTRPSAPRRGRR